MPPSAGAYCNPPSPSLWLYAAFGSLDADGLLFLSVGIPEQFLRGSWYAPAGPLLTLACGPDLEPSGPL